MTDRMKVALVVPGFSSHERDWCIPALLNYVRDLAQHAEVRVFSLRWPEQRAAYEVYGARVLSLGGPRQLGRRVVGLWARALRAIAGEHRVRPFDVVHAFWADEPGWVAWLAGAWLRRPVVVSLAGGELVSLPEIGYGLQLLPGRRLLTEWILRRAATITAGSDYLLRLARAKLPAQPAQRLQRASLGVDTRQFAPGPQASDGRYNVCINVGSLSPVKDHALLLRAVSRVPGARLCIAGQGPLRAELGALAERLRLAGRVYWLGEVDHASLPQRLAQASVFVQTSRHEAQGMALLEAAAGGVPALGTPVGVLPEVGQVAGDETALAGCLEEWLRAGRALQALGEAARARVEADFGLEVAGERFRRIYREVASSASP